MKSQSLRSTLTAVLAVIGSCISPVLGAPWLALVYKKIGALGFGMIGVGLSLILWGIKQPFVAANLIVSGVFVSVLFLMLEKSKSVFWSSIAASVTGVAVYALLFVPWVIKSGPQWVTSGYAHFTENLRKLGIVSETAPLAEEALRDLFFQIPSAIFVMFGLTAAITVMNLVRLESNPAISRSALRNFKVPEAFVWVAIASLFASFFAGTPEPVKLVALNVLNITILLYFFQGLAVFFHWLVLLKINGVLRIFLLVVFCFQFFLFLSLIGFFDVWVEFRKRKQSKRSKI